MVSDPFYHPFYPVATLRMLAISATVVCLPLNENADVRAATRKPLILASTFSSSSARPSEKYSSSALALRLAKASTAMEGAAREGVWSVFATASGAIARIGAVPGVF